MRERIPVAGALKLTIASTDGDDPIVWQVGKLLPCGRAKSFVLHRSAREAIVRQLGQNWLDAYLAQKEAELAKWGVH